MVINPIDFDRPGKQQGFLRVPYSHNLGGWANVMIPSNSMNSSMARYSIGETSPWWDA